MTLGITALTDYNSREEANLQVGLTMADFT